MALYNINSLAMFVHSFSAQNLHKVHLVFFRSKAKRSDTGYSIGFS